MYELEYQRETVTTPAGKYTIRLYLSEGPDSSPYGDGEYMLTTIVLIEASAFRTEYQVFEGYVHSPGFEGVTTRGDLGEDARRAYEHLTDKYGRTDYSMRVFTRWLGMQGARGIRYGHIDTVYSHYRYIAFMTPGAVDSMGEKTGQAVEANIDQELDAMRAWLNGDVGGWTVEDEEGNETDSCWGYYMTDSEKQYMKEEARRSAHEHASERMREAAESAGRVLYERRCEALASAAVLGGYSAANVIGAQQ